MGNQRIELLLGTLDVLILQCLSRAPSLHGYDIMRYIADCSDNMFRVEEGALYPALHRLELKGWLSSEWGVSEKNRRAKYYRLTPRGRKHLNEQKAEWHRRAGVMARVLELG
jgi:transcriptional regulator